MTLGLFRKLSADLPDSASLTEQLLSSCASDKNLNVVIETIVPSVDKKRLDVYISIVPAIVDAAQ